MPFLTAHWKNLIAANYLIDAELVKEYLPYRTELDLWQGKCFISLVGFLFDKTKILGLKIPFHASFEEINLRIYCLHKTDTGEIKRGVTFIKEIVPKPMITAVANTLYKENYQTLPTRHRYALNKYLEINYAVQNIKKWSELNVIANANAEMIKAGSMEEFIYEHYWGYTQVNSQKTYEYQVKHPIWHIHEVKDFRIDFDFAGIYGEKFALLQGMKPNSVFLADGSEISVSGKVDICSG